MAGSSGINIGNILADWQGSQRYKDLTWSGTFQNLLPAPIVSLASTSGVQSIFIIPDLVQLVSLLPPDFTNTLASLGFNWQRLAGAKVLKIEGQE